MGKRINILMFQLVLQRYSTKTLFFEKENQGDKNPPQILLITTKKLKFHIVIALYCLKIQ